MMQEPMSVEENQALGSTPSMPMVSFLYAPFVRHLSITFITMDYNAILVFILNFVS